LDERLFARLTVLLSRQPVVLACVVETRGATPRKSGSKMLITAQSCEFSIGGGLAEAQVISAARQMIAQSRSDIALRIDLSGKAESAGVCGGSMDLRLRLWHGFVDLTRAVRLAEQLQAGKQVVLNAEDLGGAHEAQTLRPNARLLIVGGGHCSLALNDLARWLEFDIWIFDQRAECFANDQFAGARHLSGEFTELTRALDSERDVYAVLLNRDFSNDVAALQVLCENPPRFLGMLGSRKRIGEVMNALPEYAEALRALHAPIGVSIDAQTPHEIAVSILAELVQERRLDEY
jgi:xanthine dehydrogenase accessory factor